MKGIRDEDYSRRSKSRCKTSNWLFHSEETAEFATTLSKKITDMAELLNEVDMGGCSSYF